MYKHILVATDGSELAGKGLDHGLRLAKTLDAAVTVLTVTEPTMVAGSGAGMAWTTGAELMEELIRSNKEHADKVLGAARSAAEGQGVAVETVHVADRYAGDAIVETAAERGHDLIVMASHGRRGLGRLLLGSQAADVLSRAAMPVLIVK